MYEINFEIIRRKLDRYIVNKYSKIICSIDSHQNDRNRRNSNRNENENNNQIKKEHFYYLTSNTIISTPYNQNQNEIKLNIFVIDGSLTIYLGYCSFQCFNSENNSEEDNQNEIKMSYIIDANNNHIGKIYYTVTISKLYSDQAPKEKNPSKSTRSRNKFFEGSKRDIIPSFRFQRLGKKVNWDLVRSLNLERFVLLCFCFVLFC